LVEVKVRQINLRRKMTREGWAKKLEKARKQPRHNLEKPSHAHLPCANSLLEQESRVIKKKGQ
jgi:hypothetical protein